MVLQCIITEESFTISAYALSTSNAHVVFEVDIGEWRKHKYIARFGAKTHIIKLRIDGLDIVIVAL
jgi:hypothetical protein